MYVSKRMPRIIYGSVFQGIEGFQMASNGWRYGAWRLKKMSRLN